MLRVSYTLLDLWSKGLKDEAVEYYLGIKAKPTPAMEYGKEYDKFITEHIKKFNRLPDDLGGVQLTKPQNQELKEYIDLENEIKFVFVPDLVDGDTLFEFKTGGTDLAHYLNSMQIPSYLFLLERLGVVIKKAYLINPTQGFYVLSNNDKLKQKAKNWLYSNAQELSQYFTNLKI